MRGVEPVRPLSFRKSGEVGTATAVPGEGFCCFSVFVRGIMSADRHPFPDARSRAEDVLVLPAGATPGEARAAFLALLPHAGFVPSPDAVAALNALADTAVPAEAD